MRKILVLPLLLFAVTGAALSGGGCATSARSTVTDEKTATSTPMPTWTVAPTNRSEERRVGKECRL